MVIEPERIAENLLVGPLPIRKLAGLPELHKDPFDRILVAQALARGPLVTKEYDACALRCASRVGMKN